MLSRNLGSEGNFFYRVLGVMCATRNDTARGHRFVEHPNFLTESLVVERFMCQCVVLPKGFFRMEVPRSCGSKTWGGGVARDDIRGQVSSSESQYRKSRQLSCK